MLSKTLVLAIGLYFFSLQLLLSQDDKSTQYSYDEKGRLVSDLSRDILSIHWNNQDQITKIIRSKESLLPDLEIAYDALGNRLMKLIMPRDINGILPQNHWVYTYYHYDPTGNLMGTSTKKFEQLDEHTFSENLISNNQIFYTEQARIGYSEYNQTLLSYYFTADLSKEKFENTKGQRVLIPTSNSPEQYSQRGLIRYELGNHLNDIHTIVSDRKVKNFSENENLILPEVIFGGDYYPGGMPLTGRMEDSELQFGFNGMERLDEVYGKGNTYDFGKRLYDARMMRSISIDPLFSKYPESSPYQFFNNNPSLNTDLHGLEGVQYLEMRKRNNGTTQVKRIVELTLYVGISEKENTFHYKKSDLSTIKNRLEAAYNRGFKDAQGHDIKFRFNIKSFDIDKETGFDMRIKLLKDLEGSNFVKSKNGRYVPKGAVLERTELRASARAQTKDNHILVNRTNGSEDHTIAHEVAHVLLNGNPDNPDTAEKHQHAGGIFTYRVIDQSGKTVSSEKALNQENVKMILNTLPEVSAQQVNDPESTRTAKK